VVTEIEAWVTGEVTAENIGKSGELSNGDRESGNSRQ
jgi:hypothetical protein